MVSHSTQQLLSSFYASFPSPIELVAKSGRAASKRNPPPRNALGHFEKRTKAPQEAPQKLADKTLKSSENRGKRETQNRTLEKKKKEVLIGPQKSEATHAKSTQSSIALNAKIAPIYQNSHSSKTQTKFTATQTVSNAKEKDTKESPSLVSGLSKSTGKSKHSGLKPGLHSNSVQKPPLASQTSADQAIDWLRPFDNTQQTFPSDLPVSCQYHPPSSMDSGVAQSQPGFSQSFPQRSDESSELNKKLVQASHSIQNTLGYLQGAAEGTRSVKNEIIKHVKEQQSLMKQIFKIVKSQQEDPHEQRSQNRYEPDEDEQPLYRKSGWFLGE